jgi:CheY-like chemotaxis protein
VGLIHVVDDEDIIRELVGETLKRLGHEVHLHATPSSLFNDDTLGDGDVIVTDMLLPQMDGFKLMERLRSAPHTKSVPIVAMTALKWGVGLEERLRTQYAVEHVLQKPLRKEELVAAISCYAKATATTPESEPAAIEQLLPVEHELIFIGFNAGEARMLATSLDYLARATISVSLPEELHHISRVLGETVQVPSVALIDEHAPVAVIAEVAQWARRTGARAAIVLQSMPFLREVLSKELGIAFIEAYEVPRAVTALLEISARKSPRVPLTTTARVYLPEREGVGQLLDVSVGGARLSADLALESGAAVHLGFALPPPVSHSFAQLSARVRWVRKSESGLLLGTSFEQLVGDELRALERFIAARRRAVRIS